MPHPLVDTHAHLDMPEFDEDREDMLSRAAEAGIAAIITVGITVESSRAAITLADTTPTVFAAVGIHPNEADSFTDDSIDELRELAGAPRVVAVGEIGLDCYHDDTSLELQKAVLRQQLTLASELDMPGIIHCREAEDEMVPLLDEWVKGDTRNDEKPRGVIHCYSGSSEAACAYMDMGFYLAFGAYIGYPSSKHLYPMIASIPLDRLLVETDCPFLPPQKRRGKRNEPAYVPLTVQILSEIRGETVNEVALATTQNAVTLFRLPIVV